MIKIFKAACHTDRYAVLGSEQCHPSDVFIGYVGGDDQDGRIGITQLVGAVDLTDGPALIREALIKHPVTNETVNKTLDFFFTSNVQS